MQEERGGGRPERARSKSVRTRARILEAAALLLSERGYAATRIGDVAELAEMQGPALYYHFSSRDELIEEVIATGQRGVLDHVRAALTGGDPHPAARIRTAVAAHLDYVLTRSSFASASIRNFAQLPGSVQQRQVVLRRRYGDIWRELFLDAAGAGALDPGLDVHAARMLVLGALNWTCEWWDPRQGSLDDLVTAAVDFVSVAIAPGSGAPLPAARQLAVRTAPEAVPDRKSLRSRRRILDAGARVLSRHGYSGTRLADVAREADMQAASLYYHFGSREELIEEVVREGVRQTHDHVTAALATLPASAAPAERLDVAVMAHLRFCLESPDVTVAAIRNAGQLPEAMRHRQREAEGAYAEVWRGLVADAVAAGGAAAGRDPRIVRMLLLGALNQTAEWSDRHRSAEGIVRTARLMVRNVFAAAPAGPRPGEDPRPPQLAPVFRAPAL